MFTELVVLLIMLQVARVTLTYLRRSPNTKSSAAASLSTPTLTMSESTVAPGSKSKSDSEWRAVLTPVQVRVNYQHRKGWLLTSVLRVSV